MTKPRSSKHPWRRIAPPSAAFVAQVVVVALIATLALPPTSATSPATRTYSAPYHGVHAYPTSRNTLSGCAQLAAPPPVWNSSRGVVTLTARANATSCTNVVIGTVGDGFGSFAESMELLVPVQTPSGGTHRITVTWNVHAVEAIGFSNGTCTGNKTATNWYCQVEATWQVDLESTLIDLTTGQVFITGGTTVASTTFENYSYQSNGVGGGFTSFGSTGHLGNLTSSWNATVFASDRYVIGTFIEISGEAAVLVSAATIVGASAAVSFTMAGGASRADLVRVSVA
jgi:hypothetical protein